VIASEQREVITDGMVKVVRLVCAGFTLGVLFMAIAIHFHMGQVCQ
jgi:hypothetical protein